ncbi:MAG: tRNA (adenine-N1)-methyltransferase [Candidatus Altiarchaeota archaeon]
MDLTILFDEKGGSYLVKKSVDAHTKYGFIKADELSKAKAGDVLTSNIGKKFTVLTPDSTDFFRKAKRGPQAVTMKDCGIIAAKTGIASGSKVVEAGTGSGVLSMFLANILKPGKIVTYEVREDFAEIAAKNFERFGIKNIDLKQKNIYEGIDEENLDAIILDLPEPWLVVEHAKKSLKAGGYLTSYSPSITQSKKFSDELREDFTHETLETLERTWNMKTVRPDTRMLGHTGFITIARFLG